MDPTIQRKHNRHSSQTCFGPLVQSLACYKGISNISALTVLAKIGNRYIRSAFCRHVLQPACNDTLSIRCAGFLQGAHFPTPPVTRVLVGQQAGVTQVKDQSS